MDRQTKCQQMKMPLKWIKLSKIFLQILKSVIIFYIFQWHFHVFALFRLSISQTTPFSISVRLGLTIHFINTSSSKHFFLQICLFIPNKSFQLLVGDVKQILNKYLLKCLKLIMPPVCPIKAKEKTFGFLPERTSLEVFILQNAESN